MNLMSLFNRRTSAPVARERLQILLAHERGIVGGQPDLVAILREEILAVVAKHVAVERDKVQVKMDRGDSISMLEVEVEIPTPASPRIAVRA
jgi:cell division topological specificity factor